MVTKTKRRIVTIGSSKGITIPHDCPVRELDAVDILYNNEIIIILGSALGKNFDAQLVALIQQLLKDNGLGGNTIDSTQEHRIPTN